VARPSGLQTSAEKAETWKPGLPKRLVKLNGENSLPFSQLLERDLHAGG